MYICECGRGCSTAVARASPPTEKEGIRRSACRTMQVSGTNAWPSRPTKDLYNRHTVHRVVIEPRPGSHWLPGTQVAGPQGRNPIHTGNLYITRSRLRPRSHTRASRHSHRQQRHRRFAPGPPGGKDRSLVLFLAPDRVRSTDPSLGMWHGTLFPCDARCSTNAPFSGSHGHRGLRGS